MWRSLRTRKRVALFCSPITRAKRHICIVPVAVFYMFRSRAQNWCTDRVEPPALISLLVTLLIIFNSLAQPRASGVPNILLSGYQPSYIAVLRVEMLLVQATATSYPRWHTSGRQFRRQSRPQRGVGFEGIGNRNFSLIMTVVIVVTHGGSNVR